MTAIWLLIGVIVGIALTCCLVTGSESRLRVTEAKIRKLIDAPDADLLRSVSNWGLRRYADGIIEGRRLEFERRVR